MNKQILSLVTILISIFLLTSCSSSDNVYVEAAKNHIASGYNKTTYYDAITNLEKGKGSWNYLGESNGVHVVQYSGTLKIDKENKKMIINFNIIGNTTMVANAYVEGTTFNVAGTLENYLYDNYGSIFWKWCLIIIILFLSFATSGGEPRGCFVWFIIWTVIIVIIMNFFKIPLPFAQTIMSKLI